MYSIIAIQVIPVLVFATHSTYQDHVNPRDFLGPTPSPSPKAIDNFVLSHCYMSFGYFHSLYLYIISSSAFLFGS